MIGGYKSKFLADLVASYLFEKAKAHFHPTIYHGIYRNDGLVVFKGSDKCKRDKRLVIRAPENSGLGIGKPTPQSHRGNLET